MRYASSTSVAPEQSRLEIERTLRAYGATQFGYLIDERKACVVFVFANYPIRLELPLPDVGDKSIRYAKGGKRRTEQQQQTAHNQAIRQAWRVLLLLVKAKLEAVDAGISTVEKEFFADLVLPSGRRLFDELQPRLPQLAAGESLPLTQLEGPP